MCPLDGCSKPASVFSVVLEQSLGKKAKLEMLPMQDGDVPATYADTENLEADTGFKPRTSVEHGIARFVEWYKSYHGHA